MSKVQPEFQLQCAIAEYLQMQWPDVLFLSDVRAQLKLTAGQAARAQKIQKLGFSCPDMMIFAARHGYHGMFLELKAESPYTKDGRLKKLIRYRKIDGMRIPYDHLAEQDRAIDKLSADGYFAGFYWDFTEAKRQIDWYLNG